MNNVVVCLLLDNHLWPSYTSTCVSRHRQLRTVGFCWSKVFTASIFLLTATSTFGLQRRHYSSQLCLRSYLCCLYTIFLSYTLTLFYWLGISEYKKFCSQQDAPVWNSCWRKAKGRPGNRGWHGKWLWKWCACVTVMMFSWFISVHLFICLSVCLSICCLHAVGLYFCLCFSVPPQNFLQGYGRGYAWHLGKQNSLEAGNSLLDVISDYVQDSYHLCRWPDHDGRQIGECMRRL